MVQQSRCIQVDRDDFVIIALSLYREPSHTLHALGAGAVAANYFVSLPRITTCRSSFGNSAALARDWVGTACWWLAPLYDLVVSTVLSSGKVFADDTTVPVLDPGRGRTCGVPSTSSTPLPGRLCS